MNKIKIKREKLLLAGVVVALIVVKATCLSEVDAKAARGYGSLVWHESKTPGEEGKMFWYEDNRIQGTYYDKKCFSYDGTLRGREIFDPASDGWYWLDVIYNGAKATGKEVFMPYVYQEEDSWTDSKKREVANESDQGMGDQVYDAIINKRGKWVRYDENGKMLKGWVTIEGGLATIYPDQAGNKYYYDQRTGLMAKGKTVIDGQEYYFDETTGVLQK